MSETKEALLDAAERLFASQSVAQTSLRSITREARANLAAVNYHFGSKEGLVRAVLDRRLLPLNNQRLELLEAAEADADAEGPPLEQVVHAFVAPAFQLGEEDSQTFARCLGRMHFETDPGIRDLIVESFESVAERFFLAIHRAVPEISPQELLWRFHFAIGAMAMTVVNRPLVDRMSKELLGEAESELATERMVSFLTDGFRAEPFARPGDSSFDELMARPPRERAQR